MAMRRGFLAQACAAVAAGVLLGDACATEQPQAVADRPPVLSARAAQAPEGKLLQRWWDEGTAAGNEGDGYLNLDGGHATFQKSGASLTQVVTLKPAEAMGRFMGGQPSQGPATRVIIANSSTRAPRSHMLNLVSSPPAMEMHYKHHWRGNGIYVTPCLNDFLADADGIQGISDVCAANVPYMVSSQGASGTDLPFVNAFFHALASFRPEVKDVLVEEGLVAPALHWCLRHSFKGVTTAEEYMSWRAHPPAMVGRRDPGKEYDMGYRNPYPRGESNIDLARMMTLAHDMTVRSIPPLVQMKVEEEDFSDKPGDGHFDRGHTERLHTTPGAIARIFRGRQYRRRLVVSAADTISPAKVPLRFHWKLLQGPADKVTIKPLDDDRTRAEILVEHFEPFLIHDASAMVSSRIDIGVFAEDGQVLSVPGLISFYAIPFEARTWDEQGRLLEIGWGVGRTEVGCRHARLKIAGRSEKTALGEQEHEGYAVKSWTRAFACLAGEGDPVAVKLLQARFPPDRLAALQRKAAEFLPLQERFLAALALAKKAGSAEGDIKRLQEAVDRAGKELAEQPGAENEHKLAEARRKLAEARQVEADAAATKASTKGQNPLLVTSTAAAEVLAGPDAAIGASLKEAFEAALQSIVDDPKWFFSHQDQLAASLQSLPPDQQKRRANDLAVALARCAEVGLIRQDENGRWILTPLRAGDDPVAPRLTAYERFLLRRLNANVMGLVVFRDFFNARFAVNFVDPRLSVLKNWRDVFHYAADGSLTGWTRHAKGQVHEFTADGRLVVSKDEDGRAVETEDVEYPDPVMPGNAIEKFDALRVEWRPVSAPAEKKRPGG